jgi:hypothetical protein
VLVAPRASSDRVIGLHAGRLKIGITAPPVDGAANEHTVRFVAEVLGVTKGQVTLARGATGRRKRLLIAGISLGEAIQRLQGALPEERKTP